MHDDLAVGEHMHTAVGEHLHDLRVQHMLDIVNMRLECVDIPAFLDRKRTLRDNRAAVVLGICKMYGHTRHLDAPIKRILNCMGALKPGSSAGCRLTTRLGNASSRGACTMRI